jgi:hypothetical protein
MTLRPFHPVTARCRLRVPYRRTGFTFGTEQFNIKVIIQRVEINTFRKISRRPAVGSSNKLPTEQTGGNYIINQGWLTVLRASAQLVYEFRRHLFVCPWEGKEQNKFLESSINY